MKPFVPINNMRLEQDIRFIIQGLTRLLHSVRLMISALLYFANATLLIGSISVDSGVFSGMVTSLYQTIILLFVLCVGLFLLFLLGTPKGYIGIMRNLTRIGITNANGETPILLRRIPVPKTASTEVWVFISFGVAFSCWEDNVEKLESAFDISFVSAEEGNDARTVKITVVLHPGPWPKLIPWSQNYMKPGPVLVLGENRSEQITHDLSKIAHILIAGRTGCGKSILQKSLMLQCILKGMEVTLVDYKRGVDYTGAWHTFCNIITDDDTLLCSLQALVDEMIARLDLLEQSGFPNIDKYNSAFEKPLIRKCLFFDEIAECLDKNGESKERKEKLAAIEACLSSITRLGRAAGIHAFLATQRGSADVINGQIRNNVFKICGSCDENLSILTIGNADAAKRIPARAIGRFLTEDKIMFQGYYSDYSEEEFPIYEIEIIDEVSAYVENRNQQ